MERTPEQEAYSDFDFAAAFPGTSRADVTLALADAEGRALTVAELQNHTDVTATTVRKTLAKLMETGLVEQAGGHGRLAYRLSPKGLLGLRLWRNERRSAEEIARRAPQRTAALYRWRVRGIASAPGTLGRRDVQRAFAEAGIELGMVDAPQHWVGLEYDVDAADEAAALAAAGAAGWQMMPMFARAERTGLAAALPTRAGHELRFAERDPARVEARLRREVNEQARMLEQGGHLPSSWEDLSQAAATIGDFLALVVVPDDGRVPLPDDERLVAAISSLWPVLEAAGVRAVGPAFEVSERDLREHYATLAERAGGPPTGMTWEQLCEEAVERHRREGRLAP